MRQEALFDIQHSGVDKGCGGKSVPKGIALVPTVSIEYEVP